MLSGKRPANVRHATRDPEVAPIARTGYAARVVGANLNQTCRRLPQTRSAEMIACWIEWKRACALGLCSNQTRGALEQYAQMRFRTYVRRYAESTNVGRRDGRAPDVDACQAWHLLETHLVVNSTGQGKRYKDWLFARADHSADPPLDVIQGGASLIMRDVVREHLRREYSPAHAVSTSEPLWAEGKMVTIEDLLPGGQDPAGETGEREWERLASERAAREFADATHRERVALAARSIGLSLAHAVVEQTAGCRKSVLSATLRALVERVAARVRADFRAEDSQAMLMLSLMTLSGMRARAVEWAKSERACDPLFNLLEESAVEHEAA